MSGKGHSLASSVDERNVSPNVTTFEKIDTLGSVFSADVMTNPVFIAELNSRDDILEKNRRFEEFLLRKASAASRKVVLDGAK